MLLFKVCLLSSVSMLASSFHVDEGCEVKAEWLKVIRWGEYRIGAWVSFTNDYILELRTTFEDLDNDFNFDEFTIHQNSTTVTEMRDLNLSHRSQNTSVVIKEGWSEFIFRVDHNYTLLYVHENKTHFLLNKENTRRLDSILIKGSNITMNCPTNLHAWYISEGLAVVPLDNSENHLTLSMYSKGNIVASIILGFKEFPLGWEDNAITTLSADTPLPGFTLHNISITCSNVHRTICIIQDIENEKKLEEVSMRNMPEAIVVKKRGNGAFSVMLFKDTPHPSLPTKPDSITASYNISTILLVTSLALELILGSVYWYFKVKTGKKIKKAVTPEAGGNSLVLSTPLNETGDIKSIQKPCETSTLPRKSKGYALLPTSPSMDHKTHEIVNETTTLETAGTTGTGIMSISSSQDGIDCVGAEMVEGSNQYSGSSNSSTRNSIWFTKSTISLDNIESDKETIKPEVAGTTETEVYSMSSYQEGINRVIRRREEDPNQLSILSNDSGRGSMSVDISIIQIDTTKSPTDMPSLTSRTSRHLDAKRPRMKPTD